MLPIWFISHGSPTPALEPSPARDFPAMPGALLPQSIIVASAQWETERAAVSAVASNPCAVPA
jgi:aromatic ring-opening dioxygenase catalytic subunit (LigB family)